MRPLKTHLLNPKTGLPACLKKILTIGYEGLGFRAIRLKEFRESMGNDSTLCRRCIKFLKIAERKNNESLKTCFFKKAERKHV